jgi:hypothetical protein
MNSLHYSWAQLWAFGCESIHVRWGKEIVFEFKVPIKEPNGWGFEFSHDFNCDPNTFEFITNPKQRWYDVVKIMKGGGERR